jgi:K+-transporting ATPase KdpF subunit
MLFTFYRAQYFLRCAGGWPPSVKAWGSDMDPMLIIAGLASLGLLVYLIIALLKPEKFL